MKSEDYKQGEKDMFDEIWEQINDIPEVRQRLEPIIESMR